MTFQTQQYDKNNRGKDMKKELKQLLSYLWLGRRDSNLSKNLVTWKLNSCLLSGVDKLFVKL
jgi:hypothetical protein